jgi:hypothetical protein
MKEKLDQIRIMNFILFGTTENIDQIELAKCKGITLDELIKILHLTIDSYFDKMYQLSLNKACAENDKRDNISNT